MSILVVAEHSNNALKASTLNTITAARALGAEVHVLVAGRAAEGAVKEASSIEGVAKVLHADAAEYEHFLAEPFATLIHSLGKNYTHILAPSSTFGKNILPRAAAVLDVAQITDVIEIISADTFKRPIYAGNVIATVRSRDAIKVMTIRTTAFAKAALSGNAPVEVVAAVNAPMLSTFEKLEANMSARPDLTAARIVISGGRGMGSGENFKLLEAVADKLKDCAIGASRAAVDAGFVPNDYQVGQTGKIVAPDIYIAVGISGAIQHLAGMKDSKVIVAINKDENAPIFEVADYGLVADLFQVLPELERGL